MLLLAALYSLSRRPDPRKHHSEGPETGSHSHGQNNPKLPVTAERVLPCGLNAVREVDVHRGRGRQARCELHEQVPDEGIEPRGTIHAHATQNEHGDYDSADMRQHRRREVTIHQKYILKPNPKSGNRPDGRGPNQFPMIQKQANRQEQIPDVAHPEEITGATVPPIVKGLAQKENQRKQPYQPEARAESLSHCRKNITRDEWKQDVFLTCCR